MSPETDAIDDYIIDFDPDDIVDSFFFHGKESGPGGTKTQALKKVDGCLRSPDFRGKNLEERLKLAEHTTLCFSNIILVGSSMGGLVASLHYQKRPRRFLGLLLLAPAFHWEEAKHIETFPENTVVIHGTRDEVVPYEVSEQFQKKFGFKLIGVDDGHRLHNSLDIIVNEFKALLRTIPYRDHSDL